MAETLNTSVGIVTFHCSYNFGSALQAYALQTVIRSLGFDAFIIDYRSPDYDAYRLLRAGSVRAVLSSIAYLPRNIKRRRNFRAFWDECFFLSEKKYSFRKEDELLELNEFYDAFVCGSDQIWNLDCTKGAVGPFFLSFASDDKKKISYAASLTHTSFNPEYFDKNLVATLLSRFDSISIREPETRNLFQPLVEREIKVTIDPTLLLLADDYFCLVPASHSHGQYVFMYMLEFSSELIESAKKVSERTGLPIVYISQKRIDGLGRNEYGVGPKEFLALIANADCVLTNSFHATVFSLQFEIPFMTFSTKKSSSRVENLLDLVDAKNHLASGIIGYIPEKVPASKFTEALESYRVESLNYLKESLSE